MYCANDVFHLKYSIAIPLDRDSVQRFKYEILTRLRNRLRERQISHKEAYMDLLNFSEFAPGGKRQIYILRLALKMALEVLYETPTKISFPPTSSVVRICANSMCCSFHVHLSSGIRAGDISKLVQKENCCCCWWWKSVGPKNQ